MRMIFFFYTYNQTETLPSSKYLGIRDVLVLHGSYVLLMTGIFDVGSSTFSWKENNQTRNIHSLMINLGGGYRIRI